MGFLDILILAGLFSAASLGLRNGFIKQGVILLGTIICVVLAWSLKTPLANFLSFNLPFFSFNGLPALNIVLYQLIAFVFILCALSFLLVFAIKLAGGIEKILRLTIVLGIPSRILGFILGLVEGIVIVFVCLFVLKGTVINSKTNLIENSKFAPIILESAPGLSNVSSNMNSALNDISNITKAYDKDNKDEFNKEVIDTLLKHEIIDTEYLNKLKSKGKI